MHLNAINNDIKENANVYIGSPIGIGGHTGSSTGRHLHFGIKKSDGTFISPETYIMGFSKEGGITEYKTYESHLFTGKGGEGRGKNGYRFKKSDFTYGTSNPSRQSDMANRIKLANQKIYNSLGNQSQRAKLIRLRAEDNKNNPQFIQTGIFRDPINNASRRGNIDLIRANGTTVTTSGTMGKGVYNPGDPIPMTSGATINLELSSVVDILKTIADNSARNEQIVQLLAAIVANTAAKNGDTPTADLLKLITSAGSNNSAPITSLNNILNNSGSKDISSAVYQIAKS